MNSQIERREFTCDELRIEQREDAPPVITGHAAVFNQLSENLGWFREQIAPGAFTRAIKEDDVRALFNHDSNHILGRNKAGTLRLSEDATGLAIEIDPPDTQTGRDLLISLERGDITQMSFGFSVRVQEWDESDESNIVRTLKEVRLFDVSPVTFPAYPQTDVAKREYGSWKETQKPDLWQEEARKRELDLLEA